MDEEKKELEKQEEDEKTVEAKPLEESKESKPNKKTAEDVEKEMEEMLNDLASQMGVDKSQIKVVSYKMPKRGFKTILFESLYIILFNCLLFLGLSGYIKWCDGVWYQLIIYGLMFSGIEIAIRNAFYILFKKSIIQTFGLLLIIPPLIAAFVCAFLPFLVSPVYILRYIVVCIILLIVREFIKRYSLDFYFKHKHLKEKKQK